MWLLVPLSATSRAACRGLPTPRDALVQCPFYSCTAASAGPPKDPLTQMAIAINKRITAASHAAEIFGIVEKVWSAAAAVMLCLLCQAGCAAAAVMLCHAVLSRLRSCADAVPRCAEQVARLC